MMLLRHILLQIVVRSRVRSPHTTMFDLLNFCADNSTSSLSTPSSGFQPSGTPSLRGPGPSPLTPETSAQGSQVRHTGAIVGGVVGGAAGVLLLGLAVVFIYRRRCLKSWSLIRIWRASQGEEGFSPGHVPTLRNYPKLLHHIYVRFILLCFSSARSIDAGIMLSRSRIPTIPERFPHPRHLRWLNFLLKRT